MKVKLLNYTPNPERTIASGAKICYSPKDAIDFNKYMSDKEIEKMIEKLISSGHLSALEHASFTFSINGISRACSHQLVRHRLASFNQQSQRYVNALDGGDFEEVCPQSISKNEDLKSLYNEHINKTILLYGTLVDAGVPKEDARYILPNSTCTNLLVTMNARELLHFFSLRCCKRAQGEIRDVANAMLSLVKEVAPSIFKNAGPNCKNGKCTESVKCKEG